MQYFTAELSNGIKLLYGEIKGSPLVNLSVWFRQGDRDEDEGEESLHHLLEHLMANGSKLYPDEFAIAKIKEKTGAFLNAYTGVEFVYLDSEFLADDIEEIFSLLSDKVKNPILAQNSIDRETKIIDQELSNMPSNIDRSIYYFSQKSILNGSDLTKIPYGQDRAINKATEAKIQKIWEEVTDPGQTLIICLGDLDLDKVKNLSEKHFGQVKKRREAKKRLTKIPKPAQLECNFISPQSTMVQLNFLTIPYGHPDFYPLELLRAILSLGKDSRLYQTLRMKNSLSYGVGTSNAAASDAGYFNIKFQSSNPDKATELVYEELKKLDNISQPELDSKRQSLLKERKRRFLSNRMSLIYELGTTYSSLNQVVTLEKYEENIKKITLEDIFRVVKTYLTEEKVTVIKTKQ
ncbi:MAG: pitrilysin family protein [Candidatus Paceibacterota bacterium]|jgi:predicted Zn-dependent peptidase